MPTIGSRPDTALLANGCLVEPGLVSLLQLPLSGSSLRTVLEVPWTALKHRAFHDLLKRESTA